MNHEVCGFEHLHVHTDIGSLLDGYALPEEYSKRCKEINQQYLCITDHGSMAAVPQQIKYCDEYNLHPIFGCESYFNFEQPCLAKGDSMKDYLKGANDEEKARMRKSNHLTILARTDVGYKNLVKLTSWGYLHGFYYKPRINWDLLVENKEGLMIGSGCYISPFGQTFDQLGEDAASDMIEKFYNEFQDQFYLEIMLLDFNKQKPYNEFILKMHDKFDIPVVVTQDCFTEDTLVFTKNGWIKIQDIKVGDFVWTHKNRWREVEVVGERKLKNKESVFRVKTRVGTYACDATEDHKLWVASQKENKWNFDWKAIKDICLEEDYLTIPKIKKSEIFNKRDLKEIDLLPFLKDTYFQIDENYKSSPKGNLGCSLQYLNEDKFVSYKGFNRKFKTEIPRFIKVDDDFLEVLGWYLAEGWSEKKSNQVGFAFHKNEVQIAERIIKYFNKYNIQSKIYKVSENGIAVRFSSIVFNKFFGQICGYGANNKHLPYIDGSYIKKWSQKQFSKILHGYWLGDGCENSRGLDFASTSKIIIFELCTILNAIGIFAFPSISKPKNKNWKDTWILNLSGDRAIQLKRFFKEGVCQESFSNLIKKYKNYWLVKIQKIYPIEYKNKVYDIQVQEDHSFIANLITSSNCHYCRKEDSRMQRLMLMIDSKRTVADMEKAIAEGKEGDYFELQDKNLWLKSEEELNSKWQSDYSNSIDYELFKQAKRHTVKIAETCKGVEIDRSLKLPQFPDEFDRLKEEVKLGMRKRQISAQDKRYTDQIKMELELVKDKEFSSYFLIQKMMVDEARRKWAEISGGTGAEAAGPGRGSGPGFLLNYLLGITDVDPIKHDLLSERFLSPARGGKQMKLLFSQEPITLS
jgi:DNA polymerase III alpha subunit